MAKEFMTENGIRIAAVQCALLKSCQSPIFKATYEFIGILNVQKYQVVPIDLLERLGVFLDYALTQFTTDIESAEEKQLKELIHRLAGYRNLGG